MYDPAPNLKANADSDAEDPQKHNEGQSHSIPSPSMFTDANGNLKAVNIIVRSPCLVFSLIMGLCVGSAFLLGLLAFRSGNPFTDPANSYDIYDIRSIDYDSLRLARDKVLEDYTNSLGGQRRLGMKDMVKIEQNNGDVMNTHVHSIASDFLKSISGPRGHRHLQEEKKPQEDFGDLVYWIYEAKDSDGLFTTEGLPIMRATENTILNNAEYPDYCWLDYKENPTAPECKKPASALNIFYASSWDSALVQEIMSELTDANVLRYNVLFACVSRNLLCDKVPPAYNTDENKAWVSNMIAKIKQVVDFWDGKGELNSNVDEVSLFMAHMNRLLDQAQNVNFFVDANFNVTNPVTMFSRSMLYWGKLLDGTTTEDESDEKLKSFVISSFYDDWTAITKPDHNPEMKSYYFMIALIFDIILQILSADGLKAIASFFAVFIYLRVMIGSTFLAAVGMFEIVMSIPLSWLFFSYVFQIKYFSTLNVLCLFIVMAIGADDIFVFMDAYKQSATKGKDVLSSLESRMSYVFRRSGSAMLLTSVTTCSAFLCTLASPIANTRSFGIFAAFVIFFDYALVMTLFCTSVVLYHNYFEGKRCFCSPFWKKNNPTSTERALENADNGEEPKIDRISNFFRNKLAPFILQQRNRLIIFVIFIAWLVVAGIYTSKLQPTTSTEQFLADDHPFQRAATILEEQFQRTQRDTTSKIHFIWGLERINRQGVNQLLNPEYVGEVAFVDNFVFNEECQTAMLNACDALKVDDGLDEFIKRKNGLRSVDCFIEELGAFNILDETATCQERLSDSWRNDSWQVSESDLSSTIAQIVNTTSCKDGSDRSSSNTMKEYYDDSLGWDGQSLRYVGISVESSILNPRQVQSENVARRHYDKFIEIATTFDETMEGVCQSKALMTDLDQIFITMNNQRIYRTSGVTGSMIGVAIAFGVLLIATRKFHISFFASICIFGVLISVVGFITLLGWTLGVIEAILVSILAGFSVDYTIHLAHAYVHAEGDTATRLTEAFSEMGITVFSGMFTSIVASIPLFFCTLVFFAKFGTFLCLTISLSWIFANFCFMSLLAQFKVSMDKKCL